jgi:glycosyltransferase involved in cell wall biosynthesis
VSVGFFFLAKSPETSRLRMLVEYLREVSNEFVFILDDRTEQETIDLIGTWPGSKVKTITWQNDFAWARNQALELIESDYTCYFDPDELPNPKLLQFIREVSEKNPKYPIGYLFWFRNFYGGDNQAPELDSDWHIRMWKTGHGRLYRRVHELVMLDGQEEYQSRGNEYVCRKAPKDAFVIHAKPRSTWDDSMQLYDSIEKGLA